MKSLQKVISGIIVCLIVAGAQKSLAQTNIYSGGSGNYNTIFWYFNPARTGVPLVGTPGSSHILNIGTNDVVTVPSGAGTVTFAGIVVHDTGGSGTFILGTTSNTATTLVVTGDVVINSSGTFRAGGNSGASHNLRIGGNLTNDNVFDMIGNSGDVINVTFNGSAEQTVSGAGSTFDFNNCTLNTGGNNVNINSSIQVEGTLNFSSNGLLVVDANSNITLDRNASVSGYNANRYVQLDGNTGSNSQLIKTSNGNVSSWRITYPIGTATGGYTPFDLSSATLNNNPSNNSTLAVKALYTSSAIGQMRRTFRIVVNGNGSSTTMTNGNFYYNSSTDVSAGDVLANYSTIWFLNSNAGSWANVTGTAPGGSGFFTAPGTAQSLTTGTYFYTIGVSTAYPSTWYSYSNGVWSNPNVWTTDPSGTTLINPLSQSPSFGDEVVILNGYTVTCNVNNLVLASTKIEGGATLDMSTTTGHNLGTITGSGLLRVKGTSLPSGIYTSFVTASTGGTIEYYDTDGTMSTTQTTYNKLILSNSTDADITLTTASDLTVNGTFDITQSAGSGTVTWQINDNSGVQRTMTISGDLTVSSGGQIRVGAGNEGTGSTQPHNLTLFGNLTNNGSIKFFDNTDSELQDSDYTSGNTYTNEIQGNAVAVTFSGLSDNTVSCNNTTDFYRLILDKGSSQQWKLQINSASTDYFRLFGPNNRGSSGSSPNQVTNNSLAIANGTLELTGSIDIPNLVEGGGSLPLPQTGVLWLNSPTVAVTVTSNNTGIGGNSRMLFVYGLLRVSNGTLNAGYSRGLLCALSGQLLVEGGTINTWQLRTTNAGTGNNFAYIQSGGTVNVGTSGLSGEDVTTFPRFALPQSETVFRMTGGTLNVASPMTGGTSAYGGIMINSSSSNIQVTGGTVNVYIPASATNFIVTSNAPFYNFNVYKEGAGSGVASLSQISCNDGTATFTQNAQPLIVLNNLTIVSGNGPTLMCNGNDVTVGGNFNIETGTTFTPGANTLTFNGTGAQSWTYDGTITSLNNVVINKSAGTITCGGSKTFPDISGLTLTSGTLDDGGKTLTVTSSLSNSAVHTGSGAIVASGPTTISGNNGTFGNLTISTNSTVSTNGKQTVTGNLRLTGASTTLNIGSNNLTVLGQIYSNNGSGTAFDGTKRIITNGLRNDGGLTRQATSGVDLLFPVGTSAAATNYTPVTINATATLAGTITVRPVASVHPNITTTGQSVRYYWRVTSSGFAGISAVTHKSYTYAGATRDAASTNYRPARYDDTAFTWSYGPVYNATAGGGTTTIPNFNTGSGWTGSTTDKLDGEYTAGNSTAFQSVTVYYSRTSGNWSSPGTWSNVAVGGAVASSAPCATCPVVIGDGGSNNHTVTINANNQGGGSLFLASGSTLDCGTFTGLNFGVNTSGTGKLRIAGTAFPAGDFLSFLGQDGGTVEWYGATKTIPSTGPAPMSISLTTYYNLTVNPSTGQNITLPANDLTIYNDFTSGGTGTGQVRTNTGAARNITVQHDMNVSSASFIFSNGNSTSFDVAGDLTINGGAVASVQTGGTRTHTLTITGSIINNGTATFISGNEAVNITFSGSTNTSFTGSATSTSLNQLTINKGTSQAATLTFDVTGAVSTPTNNWLTLSNGTMNFANSNTYNLSTATTGYNIPSTACLKVSAGTVTIVNSSNNNADLTLAGKLEVAGGTVNVGSSGNNTNNDIEYAAAGTPAVVVSGGTLYVNGAVRRSTSTLSGALSYVQTGGTVTVGGRNADNSRGVFEIENNSGSNFTLTGTALLQVLRSSGGSSFPDLYLNSSSSNVSSTATIELGANTLGAQSLTMNAVPSLGNFTVMGAGGNAQTVNMQSSELNTLGTLTINTASTLNTNSLDVYIAGDLTTNGTYNGSGNTTTFNGSGAQSGALSASSTFQNITVDKSSGTVTLSGTSPTITDLNILNGILDVSTIGLTVNGDIVNNSSQIGTGSITLSGASSTHTITSSGGSFTNLTLGTGATTKTVTVEGNLTINGVLNFATTNRYLNIASYQLTLGAGSSVGGAGSTAFVRTNGVSSDLGIVKNWATGSATFTYPVGTRNNYTPVQFSLNVSTAGTMTVAPVNRRHPSYGFSSTEQILNYYWIVTRGNSLAFSATGSHVYSYSAGLMGGSGGTLVAGFLNLANPTGWVTSGHGGVATSTTMTYTNLLDGNLPAAGTTYHLTAGTINTLPNPISPAYSRLSNVNVSNLAVGGDWSDPDSWTLSPTGIGAPLSSAPLGAPVVILSGARINMDVDTRSALSIKIDGMLSLGTSVGHDLGVISGTGTMRSNTNTFPAGDFTTFVSSAGGTIEYVAPMTMNNRSTYNNVSIIGTGSVTITNTDIVLNGDMTISSGATLNNAANNRNITLAKNWSNSGSFSPGTGTVIFNGSTGQTISRTTSFNNITISKSGGNVTLSGTATTTVTGTLTLTNGHLVSSSTHLISLTTSATVSGGSASSFISGPVRKVMASGTSFTYPLGSVSANRYRPASVNNTSAADTWTVQYVGNNPSNDGYNNFLFNTANMQKVSEFEYWNISRSGSASAGISLSYNSGSYNGSDIGTVANLRVGHWDGSQWDYPSGGGVHSQSGTNITGTVSVTNVTSFSPFTISSLDNNSPLPVSWLSFSAERLDNISVILRWKTAQEKNNDHFEVERSEDGKEFMKIGEVQGAGNSSMILAYQFTDSEASTSQRLYYRIKQVDYDGKFEYSSIAIIYESEEAHVERWTVFPNPIAEGQSLTIKPVSPEDEYVSIVIVSANGQTVFQKSGSFNQLSSDLESLSNTLRTGAYVLKITNGTDSEAFRIVRY